MHTLFCKYGEKKLIDKIQKSEMSENAEQDRGSTKLVPGKSKSVLESTRQDSEKQPSYQDEKRTRNMSQINPALDDSHLTFAERELESLFVQLRNHQTLMN